MSRLCLRELFFAVFFLYVGADYVGNQGNEKSVELKCGQRNPRGLEPNDRITDGQAMAGEFPWTVALLYNFTIFGGGSLLAPGVILTAAHLLRNKTAQDILVSAGEGDLHSPMKLFPSEKRYVVKIVSHDSFNEQTGANNLALLFLEFPFELTAHINTICLPSVQRWFDFGRCLVTVWGKVQFNYVDYSTTLKKIDLPIVPNAKCQNLLRRTRLGRNFMMDPSFICAGAEEYKDSCIGDGGGPLFCPMREDRERFEQVGIVNWGVDCNKGNIPYVYTRVTKFIDWINQHVESNRFINQTEEYIL